MLTVVGGSYGAAPVNTVAPVVTGTTTVGQTLTTTDGTWTGAPAPTFTYQWFRSPSTSISGATSSTYVLVAGDVGFGIFCRVRATNTIAPSGVTADSNTTAAIGGTAPVNVVAPVVSGTATFGQTLSTTDGTWTGTPAPTFTYQWQRVTTNIGGATSSTYVLVAADVGNTIRCVVTATNVAGSASANSNSTASVSATVPDAPTIGTATVTSATTATVAYTAPASNGGATITSYTATSSPSGITGTLSQAGSGTITVSGLAQGTSYTFTVTATNSIGTSAASSASNSITTYSAPVNTVAPVVSGTATFGQTLTTTDGTWTGTPSPSFTYQWQRVTTNIGGATSSTYVLVQADVGNTIRCVVTATNVVSAVSANSNSTATVAATVPDAPTIGTATATGSASATVVYTAPASNGGSVITSYTATSSPSGITGTLSQAGSGTITVSGLAATTSYTFTVKATNAIGQSAASAASNSITTSSPSWAAYAYAYDITSTPGLVSTYADGKVVTAQKYNDSGSTNIGLITTSSLGVLNTGLTKYLTGSPGSDLNFAAPSPRRMYFDTTNDYIYIPVRNFGTLKYRLSNNTTAWFVRSIASASLNTSDPGGVSSIAVDSSQNVYSVGTQNIIYACCQSGYRFQITKYDSSGTAQWTSSRINYQYGENGLYDVYLDTSSQPVAAGGSQYASGGVHGLLVQYSTAGAVNYEQKVTDSSGGTAFYGIVGDSSDNSYVVGASSSGAKGLAIKFNSSGAITWDRILTQSTVNLKAESVVKDSSNNIYVWYSQINISGRPGILAKYNSSGTIQWQRKFSINNCGGQSLESQTGRLAISSDNTIIISLTAYNTSISPKSIQQTIAYPTDGSVTGAFVGYFYSGYTLTIAAGSATDAAGSHVASTGASTANGSVTDSSRTAPSDAAYSVSSNVFNF